LENIRDDLKYSWDKNIKHMTDFVVFDFFGCFLFCFEFFFENEKYLLTE